MVALPRLVIAAPASGHGKTTVATGLMAALARSGFVASGHKVGPDYIDPGYHWLATGRPGRNLDPFLTSEAQLVPLLLHGAAGADIAIIEGAMGLYDGQIGTEGFASTAHVAIQTDSPVILVVDISHASRSIAAMVRGMTDFDSRVHIAGVILNKAGSQRHADEVKRSLKAVGVPTLAVLQRDDGITAPARHLGLVPVAERSGAAEALDRLASQVARKVDLFGLMAIARRAPQLSGGAWSALTASRSGNRPVIAVAGGRAFTFRYSETDELFQAAGCEVVTFDPLTDTSLPDGVAGVYLGGGFPEAHADELAQNVLMQGHIRSAARQGIPIVAECAGLLYLCRSLDGNKMASVVAADAWMTPRLTLSYRTAQSSHQTLLTNPGSEVRGHEFHRTAVGPAAGSIPAWTIEGTPVGFASARLHASYLHTHWAGHPELAQRFCDAAHDCLEAGSVRHDMLPAPVQAKRRQSAATASLPHTAVEPVTQTTTRSTIDPALLHHGDSELAEGLLDFAVNVYDGDRPDWLEEALADALAAVDRYPDQTAAQAAIARRHGRETSEVLPAAGATEAFTLIARLRKWRLPVVVHPQFTEPDVALRLAGHLPWQHVLLAESGFMLDPAAVRPDADLVIIGNPTNPTSVLHPADSIRALARPGRIVAVDEAFMDSVTGEKESLAAGTLQGVIVIRSLTKLWSIPGIRAGYILGPSELISEMKLRQPPWSVSTVALAAIQACSSESARHEALKRSQRIAQGRAILCDGLAQLSIPSVAAEGPFVLAQVLPRTHSALRAAGYAVRRADTFPGLGPDWIRIAVRDPDRVAGLLAALAAIHS